jgi:hypothetical protein
LLAGCRSMQIKKRRQKGHAYSMAL